MDCIGRGRIGMGRTGSDCIALDHFVPRKRFIRNKTLARPILFQINRFPGTKTPHKQESVLFPGTVPAMDRHPKAKNESGEKKSLTRY